jgi:periplasmic protein CpxP/Spy
MTSQNKSNTVKSAKWSVKKRLVVFGTASLIAIGTFATVAQSGGRSFGHGERMGGIMHGSSDPAAFEKRLDKKLKYLAFGVDATEEQQAKLKAVIVALMTDVRPMKEKLRETRTQLRTLLTQPKIDRAAIEALRVEKIALVDAISKKFTGALANAGEILNVKQRVKLGEFMKKFGHGRRS